ncbi:MAG TPA: hypothetical protein VMV43_10440 [Candidatus Nanopelagicaceae bacterium]|nr:hypothetical protein [Candidatus Nanopelagicaceae bacterium]
MPRTLIDFWVLTDNGIVLYSKVSDQKVNPQLFGALMSALNKFAEKLTDGGISNFEMSDLRFVIIKRRRFLFIGSSSNKTKEKKVIDDLLLISDQFFELYAEALINWDNNVETFSDFGDHIEQFLEK